MTGLTEHV